MPKDKLIEVRSWTVPNSDDLFNEAEFPELKKALEDGYRIKEIIPIASSNQSAANGYAVLFHLHK